MAALPLLAGKALMPILISGTIGVAGAGATTFLIANEAASGPSGSAPVTQTTTTYDASK